MLPGRSDVGFPFGFDATGRTRSVPIQDHVRDLVEQVLLTAPGERVNRPQFGSGLLGLVFEPGGSAIAAALRAQVEASLQLWLSDAIQVDGILVRADDSLLEVTVSYVVRATQERRVERVRTGSAL
jgi:phage baseplate assembly protein W